MIEIVVFSEKNPQMLSLTLQSLQKNMPNSRINVIYPLQDKAFNEGYDICKKYSVNFVAAVKYKESLMLLLKSFNKNDRVLFMTDRDVLFNSIDGETIETCLNQNDVLCFSLRLGENVTYCNRMESDNVIKVENFNDYIKWNWAKHYLDFGYPFSLQGHIFNIKEIIKLIRNVSFNSYVDLEDALQMYENYPKTQMTSFQDSKAIHLLNDNTYITYKEFLDGYIPDFNGMDFSKIKECEKEIYFENTKTFIQ